MRDSRNRNNCEECRGTITVGDSRRKDHCEGQP